MLFITPPTITFIVGVGTMWWNGKTRLIIEDGLVQLGRGPPAGIGSLSRDTPVIVLLYPFQQLVEVAALVHRVEIGVWIVMALHPVRRDRSDV